MAALSKAGCNAGTCHGNKNGKGGLKLSLRGQDPDLDYLTLTRDSFARRVNQLEPEQSLILLKPTTQLAHEGGLRFKRGSEEYEILRRWIAEGMPNDSDSAPRLRKLELRVSRTSPDSSQEGGATARSLVASNAWEGLEAGPVSSSELILVHPGQMVQVRAKAVFSDGTMRDITSLAVYEPANGAAKVSRDGWVQRQDAGETTVLVCYLHCQEPVRLAYVPQLPGFAWKETTTNNFIDEHIFAKLRALRMNPSELCADEVFMRRAYLDLLGVLPTAAEARAFVEQSPGGSRRNQALSSRMPIQRPPAEREMLARRARLIDQLLARPEFADFWALKWADLLRVEAHSLDRKGVHAFHHWIRQNVSDNKPLDQFVRELITARGSTYSSPAANYYRPNRDPLSRAKAAAQVFLGTRLQCAECHNHPSDRWTQDDYYDWAGLFARISYKVVQNKREIASDEHEWNGEQIVFLASEGSVRNPRTGKDALPRFLGETNPLPLQTAGVTHKARPVKQPAPGPSEGGERDRGSRNEVPLPGGAEGGSAPDELEALASWLTGPTNTWFARVQANRVWFHLMGRGLVDPPDDFRATNPATHPALLDALAQDFVKHKFDVRYLIRLIMTSRTYQLDSEPNQTNRSDDMNFSHALVRRLGAEQLIDCQSQATGVPLRFAGYPSGLRAAQLPGVRPESKGKRRANQWDQLLEIFGKPPRLLTSDTERSCECNMGQAFQMISGPTVNELLEEKENRVSRLLTTGKSNREILEELFWTALTRAPAPKELEDLLPGLESAPDRRPALEDILWGLLNSKDFLFRK